MKMDVQEHGAVAVARVGSSVSGSNAERVEMLAAIDEIIRGGRKRLVLNLSELTWINSSGVGLLVASMIRLKREGGELCVCEANDRVTRVLDATKLTRVMKVYPSESDAVSSLAEAAA